MATVKDGECKAFRTVAVEACGLTQADQNVLDDFVETGVSACKWVRPQPRTPTCTDLRAEIAMFHADAVKAKLSTPVKAPVKRSIMQRLRGVK